MNKALCVGINDYPGTNSDLSGCVNDANEWADALRARGFEAETLLDREATKAGIMGRLREMVAATGWQEVFVFQYSGHGTWVPDEDGDEADARDEALCPHDIADAQLITDDELYEVFCGKRRGARIVMISDSCHSGTVSRLMGPLTHDSHRRVRYLAPGPFLRGRRLKAAERAEQAALPGAGVLRRAYEREVSLLLSGCLDTEYSYDAWFGGRANGAFSRVALDALEHLPEGATYADWHAAVRRRLTSQDYPQTPGVLGPKRMLAWRALS